MDAKRSGGLPASQPIFRSSSIRFKLAGSPVFGESLRLSFVGMRARTPN